ncbi:MAG: hypothetical protein PHO57_10670 [Acidithiobacillus sp.]|nr:hypothetical protein [Acidithiobacillus sp.]
MDGSYKQYRYTPGMDLQTAVPFDAAALITAAERGADINEAEGWVRNLDTQAVERQLKTYQSQLESHINRQNGGKSTVGDVLGVKQASIDPLPYLAGSLPYTVRARSQQFSDIPNGQRAQFKYEIYTDQRAANWGESPLVRWQAPTAAVAGKKVTLAWVAASPADQAAIEALIPTPPPGQELDPSQLPIGLSSSIHLKPEIRLDGAPVATGPGLPAGSEPVGAGSFTQYGSPRWDTTTEPLIAGQQTALGLSIQGISQRQLETLKTRMEQTQATLKRAQAAPHNQREALLKDLTGEQLTGDLLTATIWGYFASLQSHGAIAGSQAGVIDLPGLQYGLFHAQVRPNKLYGIVTTGIRFQGLNMDIGHVRSLRWVKDDNPASPINNKPELTANGKTAAQNRWIGYNKGKGKYNSAMEHATPEAFWVDKTQCRHTDSNGQVHNPSQPACSEGISAVKALALAQAQGQRIYTITPSNAATALPKLPVGGEVGAEIRNAIQAGKEVTIHENPITAHGWTGYGYIIVDPETGAGAYLIEGKGNGGNLLFEPDGLKIMRLFGIGAPPTTVDPIEMHSLYDIGTIAVYSAINTLGELWNCYGKQVATVVAIAIAAVAVAFIASFLTSPVGGLQAGVAAALALISTNAAAAKSGRSECAEPQVRLQFQTSPQCTNSNSNVATTYNTQGYVIKGEVAVGVTIAQAESGFAHMLANRDPWIPNKAVPLLESLVSQSLSKIAKLPPYGVSRHGNIPMLSSQKMLGNICYRVDVENQVGTNFKQ